MKKLLCLLALPLLLVGCSAFHEREEQASSSLVDFLYPNNRDYVEQNPATPHLTLPLNVGIAFVPDSQFSKLNLTAKRKQEILSQVKREFSELNYINRIEIISDNYLRDGGGFDNLEQLSRLYNVQVMALVSYDQIARSTQNNAALLYWTIAGMYIIPGDENTTQTFVDTALFDIKSKQLLMRAPGISKIESYSTAVGLDDTFYQNSDKGFDAAVTDMVTNLKTELETFKVRVKEEQIAEVSYSNNYSGGGIAWWSLAALFAFSLIRKNIHKA